jgi:hypothetical protein
MEQVGFYHLPIEIQVYILRAYDKSLWIASRSLNTTLRTATYNEFMCNEMVYKPSINECKALCKKFCIFKRLYLLYCNKIKTTYYEGMVFYLMNNDNNLPIKPTLSARSLKKFGYRIFRDLSDEDCGKTVDIEKILFTSYPEESIWCGDDYTYDIDYDYITYIKIFLNRGFSLQKAKELTLMKFDQDYKLSEYSAFDAADMSIKLVAMHKLLGIKLKFWKDVLSYPDITHISWSQPAKLDRHLDLVNILSPTIKAYISTYDPLCN